MEMDIYKVEVGFLEDVRVIIETEDEELARKEFDTAIEKENGKSVYLLQGKVQVHWRCIKSN